MVEDVSDKARRDRARLKLLGTIVATYGYALLAGALWEPMAKGGPITIRNLAAAAIGLAMHAPLPSILRREVSETDRL